jgi:hypothetical protein
MKADAPNSVALSERKKHSLFILRSHFAILVGVIHDDRERG